MLASLCLVLLPLIQLSAGCLLPLALAEYDTLTQMPELPLQQTVLSVLNLRKRGKQEEKRRKRSELSEPCEPKKTAQPGQCHGLLSDA